MVNLVSRIQVRDSPFSLPTVPSLDLYLHAVPCTILDLPPMKKPNPIFMVLSRVDSYLPIV